MGIEAIIALIAGIVALIPIILNIRNNRKANRDALLKAESDELGAGMDANDKLQPPPNR
jgi:hypothetical protein